MDGLFEKPEMKTIKIRVIPELLDAARFFSSQKANIDPDVVYEATIVGHMAVFQVDGKSVALNVRAVSFAYDSEATKSLD
jgi:hypothetical protein